MNSEKEIKKTPKRIIFVWNYLEWGGAQIYFLALMKEVRRHCEVRALLPEGSNEQLLKFLDALNVNYEFVKAHTDGKPARGIKRKIERHFNKLRSEYIFCRELSKYDLENSVIHAEFAPWQSFGALYWLSKKTKIFTTVHNSVFPTQRWRHWIWKFKFGVLSNSKNYNIFTANEDAKKCLREYVSKEFFDSIKVTYASINPSEIEDALALEYDREELCQKFGIPTDKFLVFCVGQFIDRKGRWIFLEAAKKLSDIYQDIAFVWISNSKPPAEDLKKAFEYGLDENFVFITSEQVGKERNDLFKLIRLADIFALPSYLEGLPISLLEAMALGKPSISTEINGIPEAVKHMQTGLLIEPGEAGQLTEAIQKLKDDPKLRKQISDGGREFVLRHFDERVVAKAAWERYEDSFQQ